MSNISRKSFLKGAAAGAMGVAAMSVMGVANAETTEAPAAIDWLGEEPAIAEADIAQTLEADAIVIGAGTSGLYMAASLLEKGLKIIVIEKNAMTGTVRDDLGAIDSKLQLAEGTKIDKAVAIRHHLMYCAHRLDQRLPRIWADESGAAIDWYASVIEKTGAGYLFHEGGYEPDFDPATFPKFPTGHSPKWNKGMSGKLMLEQYINQMGCEIMFETPFVKFEYEGKKVTAAIAQDVNGKYIRLVGTKGICLCTGGYQQNPDMLHALQPDTCDCMTPPAWGSTCGDGHKACIWMGAEFDECHSSMLFDRGGLLPDETPATATRTTMFRPGSQPFLKVNLNGERFANESTPYDYILHASCTQPGKCYAIIFDDDYLENIKQFETVGCSRFYPYHNGGFSNGNYETIPADFEKQIADGFIQKADTVEELAEKLNIPAENLAKTVARYNELCDKGVDEDFYKDAYRMIALKKPPYYGIRCTGRLLSTMDGIRLNDEMRPVDANCEPFEGVFVLGDTSGGYFAHTYPNLFTGYANGRTITFVRRVARIIAGEPKELKA